MLAEKKKKMRLPQDPNNKNWTEGISINRRLNSYFNLQFLDLHLDTSSFGRKILEKMGWKSGQGLGLHNDGTTSHIKIAVKDDNLGIGASLKDSETGWLNNSKSYQEVLDRLSKSCEVMTDKGSEVNSTEGGEKVEKRKKDKKKKKKDKKEEKKRSKKYEKYEKSKKEKVENSSSLSKFIKNKAVSSYSEAHLKEILGGFSNI